MVSGDCLSGCSHERAPSLARLVRSSRVGHDLDLATGPRCLAALPASYVRRFPQHLFENEIRNIALCDFLTRAFHRAIRGGGIDEAARDGGWHGSKVRARAGRVHAEQRGTPPVAIACVTIARRRPWCALLQMLSIPWVGASCTLVCACRRKGENRWTQVPFYRGRGNRWRPEWHGSVSGCK